MASLSFVHITSAGRMNTCNSLQEAEAALSEGGYLWIDAFKPERELFEQIANTFNLHPLAVEDCFDDNLVPKMEDYQDSAFFIFNSFRYLQQELELQEIDVFLGKKFIITVSGFESDKPESLKDIQKLVSQNAAGMKGGPSYLFYFILDRLVDHKFSAIEAIEDELETMEEQIVESPDSFQAPGLIRLRRHLLLLRKSLFHEREILVKICRKDCPFVAEKIIFQFRDIYDHLNKFFELTENYREMVSGQMELYMSVQNYNLTRNSNETNAFIKRLTLITTIFMPLSLLAGIGGMSEWTMMTGAGNWKWSYPLFLLGMVVIAFLNYRLLRRIEMRRKDAEKKTAGS